MTTYALFRQYDPTMTRAQIDGMVLASGAALQTYIFRGGPELAIGDHGIHWLRSYWEQGGEWGMCLFEAPSLSILSGFQELCGTPFTDAMEVSEIETASPTPGRVIAANLRLPPTSEQITATQIREPLGDAGSHLLRAFTNGRRGMAVAVLPPDVSLPAGVEAAPVVEILPSEYA